MTIEQIFRFLHSWNRWLLIVAAVIALVYFARGWLTSQPWTKFARTLQTIFSSLVDLQWLLGLILLISYGSITGFGIRHYWEHLTVQTIALVVAHLHVRWRKKELEDKTRYQRGFLILIFVGIMALPAGIQWRTVGL
jgi:multisubunit Na+/H+ antiporter MnhB subunit